MDTSLLDSLAASAGSPVTDTRSNPALAAKQRAEQEKASQNQQMAEIKQKGFVAFVRDAMAENFRAKLREKFLKAMGLDEASLAKLPAAQRNAIEQAIEQAIKLQLEQANGGPGQTAQPSTAKAEDGNGTAAANATSGQGASTVSSAVQAQAQAQDAPQSSSPVTQPAGQKKPGGISCPVIPILAWPGGPSLLG